jgi:hypothetical protein
VHLEESGRPTTTIYADNRKETDMKRSEQNDPRETGIPNMGGYPQGAYPGYQAPQGYPAQNGYPAQSGYPTQTGYPQAQGYAQPQGYAFQRNYQTPQLTGNQPAVNQAAASSNAAGQEAYGSYQPGYPSQTGYTQQGYPSQTGYAQPGYSQPGYSQVQGYPPQNPGAGYPPAPGGSYIPQTPYSQGYTSPGYQAPAGYGPGYDAYGQMGRVQQPSAGPAQDLNQQVPLNGGGYIPQPVPVRKQPFVMTDAYLLILSAALLVLFALGMFVPGLGVLKWIFLVLAVGTAALFWIRPMIASNKRICYSIVFSLLVLVTVIGLATGGTSSDARRTDSDPVRSQATAVSEPASQPAATPALNAGSAATATPEPETNEDISNRTALFFTYWKSNDYDNMLAMCAPSWQSKEDNPRNALFQLLRNRTPREAYAENVSGTVNDTSRTVTVVATMDTNTGSDPVKYRMSVIMVKESGEWYVDPKSLQTYENAETPDPSITPTPAPATDAPVYANTVLYYNPQGGEFYHLDQNCKRIHEKFLPLQGHFTYAELDKTEYSSLKPCNVCNAPARGK